MNAKRPQRFTKCRFSLKELWSDCRIRYLFFGGLTVVVNLLCFYLLEKYIRLDTDAANALSIIVALLFAYVTNTWFVFCSKRSGAKARFAEFARFVAARLFTMALEFVSVHFLVNVLFIKGLFAKLAMQAVVIVLNYIFSRRIVYRDM